MARASSKLRLTDACLLQVAPDRPITVATARPPAQHPQVTPLENCLQHRHDHDCTVQPAVSYLNYLLQHWFAACSPVGSCHHLKYKAAGMGQLPLKFSVGFLLPATLHLFLRPNSYARAQSSAHDFQDQLVLMYVFCGSQRYDACE